MTMEQVQELGREWGWLSGPAVMGLWLVTIILRALFRQRLPEELMLSNLGER